MIWDVQIYLKYVLGTGVGGRCRYKHLIITNDILNVTSRNNLNISVILFD